MGGYSMRPLIFDEGKWEGPNGALTLVGNNGYGKSADQQTYSYRTRKYRYIKYGNGKKELYNHKIDPFEWNNIIDEKKYDDETKGLENEMNNILTQR